MPNTQSKRKLVQAIRQMSTPDIRRMLAELESKRDMILKKYPCLGKKRRINGSSL